MARRSYVHECRAPNRLIFHPPRLNNDFQLIEYWSLTGDDSYNHLVTQGMLFQVGDGLDYEPSNQTTSEVLGIANIAAS